MQFPNNSGNEVQKYILNKNLATIIEKYYKRKAIAKTHNVGQRCLMANKIRLKQESRKLSYKAN